RDASAEGETVYGIPGHSAFISASFDLIGCVFMTFLPLSDLRSPSNNPRNLFTHAHRCKGECKIATAPNHL
ncbi:MAG: hypothetical protein RIS70_4188, partial [Planctomycetota bacterium]